MKTKLTPVKENKKEVDRITIIRKGRKSRLNKFFNLGIKNQELMLKCELGGK